jgi:glycerophosphoryl diester phosphodiesterase
MTMGTFLEDIEGPLLFGHRGYSATAPENTLAAFGMCLERHVPGVELDVHLCKTGELVVVHDSNLRRVSGKDLLVEELSFPELRKIDVGSHKGSRYANERVPLLSEVFGLCGDRLYYDIELKSSDLKDIGLEQKTWDTIGSFGLGHRCMVSSFNPFALKRFDRIADHTIPTAVIYEDTEGVPRIFRHGWGRHIARCSYLKPDKRQVTRQTMARLHERKGYPVCTWTVETETEAEDLLALGVDGIIANAPGDFLDLVSRYRRS